MSKKRFNRRDFLHLTGLVVAGTVMAGCTTNHVAPTATTVSVTTTGPQPISTSAPQGTDSGVPKPAPTQDLPEEAPGVSGVAREDTLVFAFSYGTPLDVNQNLGYMTSQQGNACVLEPLYFFNPHDSKSPLIPWLADGKYSYNKDYTELTVKLRKDATWSDGTPFTSADVVWTVNFAISQVANKLPPPAYGSQIANNFKEAVASDDFTVVFRSLDARPNPRMHRWICSVTDTGLSIMPKHIFEKLDPKTIDQQTFITNTKFNGIVTAPYICVYNTNEKRIFDVRPDWWGVKNGFAPLPQVKRIIVLPGSIDQAVLAQSYSKNEIDTSLAPLPSSMKSIIDQNPQLTTWTGRKMPLGNVDPWPNLLWLDNEDPLFNDSRVRWAISYAINPKKLIDDIWSGMGIPSRIPFTLSSIFQPYIDALTPLLDQYPVGIQDLNKSAALMKEAGWTKNVNGIWEKGGTIFQPNFGGFNALYSDIGPALCEQLTQAGFKTDYKEPPDLWSGALAKGVLNMCVFGVACDLDVYDVIEYFHSRHYAPNGTALPLDSWNARFKNSNYDAIVDQMSKMNPEDDSKAYIDMVVKAMTIWYKELPAIPIWQWIHFVPMNTRYWTGWPSQDDPYGDPAMWLRNGGFITPMHVKKAKA